MRGFDVLMPIAHAIDSCGKFSSPKALCRLLNSMGGLPADIDGKLFVEINHLLTSILNKVSELKIEDLLRGEVKDVITVSFGSQELRDRLDSLSLVVSSDARERISVLSDGLLRKIQGASDALDNSADGVSQASNSLIELVDRLLRAGAPSDEALHWLLGSTLLSNSTEMMYKNDNGKTCPTKQGEALYFISGGRQASECENDSIMRYIADGLNGARRALQKLKHSDTGTENERNTVRQAARAIEGFISYGLRVGWYLRSDDELDRFRGRLAPS